MDAAANASISIDRSYKIAVAGTGYVGLSLAVLLAQHNQVTAVDVVPEKAAGEDGLPLPPYAVYNIGGGQPENLLDYISTLQEELVRAKVLPEDYDFEGHRELVGMQAGDVPITYADSEALEHDYGFRPEIGIREGLRKFAEWYKEYYKA